MPTVRPEYGEGWVCRGCGAVWYRFDSCLVCALTPLITRMPLAAPERASPTHDAPNPSSDTSAG